MKNQSEANWKPDERIDFGQLLYLKGQLRVLTVLSILAVVHQRHATLSEATLQQILVLLLMLFANSWRDSCYPGC